MKKCIKCGRELPEEMFAKCSTTKDGLQSYCKDCKKEVAKRRYEEKTRNKIFEAPATTGTELSRFSARELMEELRLRGFTGELMYTQKVMI